MHDIYYQAAVMSSDNQHMLPDGPRGELPAIPVRRECLMVPGVLEIERLEDKF